jgi:hypothetical protein
VALEYLGPTSIVSSSQWTAEDLTWIDDPWLTPNDDVDYMNSFQVTAPITIRLRFAPAVGVPSTTLDIGGAYFRIKLLDDIQVFPATIQVFFQSNLIATSSFSISNLDGEYHNYSTLFSSPLSVTEAKLIDALLTVTNDGSTRVRLTAAAFIVNTSSAADLATAVLRTDRHGLRQVDCAICGFAYYEDEVIYRNGTLACTVRAWNKDPCFDEPGPQERVRTRPLRLGPIPDASRFPQE